MRAACLAYPNQSVRLEQSIGKSSLTISRRPVGASNNIYIGDSGDANESNTIAIGNLASSETSYTSFFVGAVYGVTTFSGVTLPVIVSDDGQLGTTPSAARFKKEIKPMDKLVNRCSR